MSAAKESRHAKGKKKGAPSPTEKLSAGKGKESVSSNGQSNQDESPVRSIADIVSWVVKMVIYVACIGYAGYHAHDIRMHAIRTYGLVIHEFDPWFNFLPPSISQRTAGVPSLAGTIT